MVTKLRHNRENLFKDFGIIEKICSIKITQTRKVGVFILSCKVTVYKHQTNKLFPPSKQQQQQQ